MVSDGNFMIVHTEQMNTMEGSKSTFKINNNQCNRLRVSLFKNISIICNHQNLVTELGGCCSGKQLGVSSSAGGHTSYLPPEIYRLHTGTAIVHSTLITCFAKSAYILCLKGQHQKKVWDHVKPFAVHYLFMQHII